MTDKYSKLGREPYPGGSIYCATKAAVRSFSDSLRKELIASRVRVIEVDPGQVETVRSLVFPPRHIYVYVYLSSRPTLAYTSGSRNSLLCDSMATSPRPTPCMREYPQPSFSTPVRLTSRSGCEPLTPDDIAEIVVFSATRRENVVVADTLVFPNHQVRYTCPDPNMKVSH